MTEQAAISNIERMVILKVLEDYTINTKDANQRAALLRLRERLMAANRLILEAAATEAA